MPKPFRSLNKQTFAELVARYPWGGRRVNEVHLHHTWLPNHSTYQGLSSIEAMWKFHTEEQGWRDIAQHVSIGKDGAIWTGRHWSTPPASAGGKDPKSGKPYNGDAQAGPFMIEMIGNFDKGEDKLEGAQLDAALEVIARVQMFFGLPPERLRFHREMTDQKTCPGNGLPKTDFLAKLRRRHEEIREASASRSASPFDLSLLEDHLQLNDQIAEILRELGAAPAARGPAGEEGEPLEERTTKEQRQRFFSGENPTEPAPAAASRGEGATSDEFRESPEVLSALRPHVINLNAGRFSTDGAFDTGRDEVDAIFLDHLPRRVGALEAGRKLPVVFYAHGGLVSEGSALRLAHQHIEWWNDNGAYPIYFVWETGLLETVGQLAKGKVVARGLTDWTDRLVEKTLGPPARLLWTGMKRSAAQAVADPDDGAAYVAARLNEFLGKHGDRVDLHAIGHSAGSIFHSHFLPTVLGTGAATFRSLSFLAPAIRVDEFRDRLQGRIGDGNGIDRLCLFTMKRDWELADKVTDLYRKSLLYLIHYALEDRRGTPILGLEESLRGDADLREFFGLAGTPSPAVEVVWSKSVAETGTRASRSTSHGGFDNDPPTMESVALRILGLEDNARLKRQFPEKEPAKPGPLESLGAPMSRATPAEGAGRRVALCVGVDNYPTQPLFGCVRDAESWASTFRGLGFEVRGVLRDQEATYDRILGEVTRLVAESRPGDVIAFQFAGHGTQLEDYNGDEQGDPDEVMDEAMCPFGSLEDSRFLIDDDWVEVFAGLKDGVSFTCFFDCCHSGTIMRAWRPTARGDGGRARWVRATPEMNERHRQFRQTKSTGRGVGPNAHDRQSMKQVVFAACQAREEALEHEAQGDFTRRATAVLREGIAGLTNQAFQAKVVAAFGPGPAQNPVLDCADQNRQRDLLMPVAARDPGADGAGNDANPRGHSDAELAKLLATAAEELAERLASGATRD